MPKRVISKNQKRKIQIPIRNNNNNDSDIALVSHQTENEVHATRADTKDMRDVVNLIKISSSSATEIDETQCKRLKTNPETIRI